MRTACRLGALLLLAGCSGASNDPGSRAWLRVANAEYVPGAMPAGGPGGPTVGSVYVAHNRVEAGSSGLKLTGALALDASSAAVGLAGDLGYWVVTAGPPDVQSPDQLSLAVRASFSLGAPEGPRDLEVRAVDAQGRFGPPFTVPMEIAAPAKATGELAFTLSWDTEADLDLHVVDPTGTEVWAGNVNSWERPPPGTSGDPDGWTKGGLLDADSNAQCVIDGLRRESVAWPSSPPPGHYVVRVETASLCLAASARWTVEARVQGEVVGRSSGASTPESTRFPHGLGAGVLALELDLP